MESKQVAGLRTAHKAICSAVDALNPAWEHLLSDDVVDLQVAVLQLESVRDGLSSRIDRAEAAERADRTRRGEGL